VPTTEQGHDNDIIKSGNCQANQDLVSKIAYLLDSSNIIRNLKSFAFSGKTKKYLQNTVGKWYNTKRRLK